MPRKKISTKTRNRVRERGRGCCEYCQVFENFSPELFPIEHIIPISKGGSNSLTNLAFACHGCNWSKSNKVSGVDPITEKEVALFHPRNDSWKDHFAWSEDFLTIYGRTSIGRATVKTLKLNRSNLINLRYALSVIGVHPPSHTINIQ